MSHSTLSQLLAERTKAGKLFLVLPDGRIQCHACAHRCVLKDGQSGICRVRSNEKGVLRVPFGYTAGLQADPIEKKPFFHVLPGSKALSFGMLGCNFHCDYCQNWLGSQALRDSASRVIDTALRDTRPEDLMRIAMDQHCPVMTSTYNEPTITAEWAEEVFRLAKQKGLLTSIVSNGNATSECLDFLLPVLDLIKVDLKAFRDETYQKVFGGSLDAVKATIERSLEKGLWLEVVTLVVPGLNDSDKELGDIARYLATLSRDVPWHVTAFHPDYRMEDTLPTSPDSLRRAWELGKAAGLHYVYSGNRPGAVGESENTLCPTCAKGYCVTKNDLGPTSICPACQTHIPGRWTS
jgi:pyruvate formate lyase activating enzyme